MAPIKHCCYALAILLPFLVSLSAADQPAGDYHSFCQKTSMATTCIEDIEGPVSPVLRENIHGWMEVLKLRGYHFVYITRVKINAAILTKPGPDLANRLDICLSRFDGAIPILQDINMESVNHSNYVEYNRKLGFVLSAVIDCVEAFVNVPPPIPNPVEYWTQNSEDSIKLALEGLNIYQCDKRTACN